MASGRVGRGSGWVAIQVSRADRFPDNSLTPISVPLPVVTFRPSLLFCVITY